MVQRGDEPSALGDIRVLDLSGEMGMYCGKLLADLGADVIKIEPPGGDPARRVGPFYHDEPDVEKSLSFFYLNTSKRGITLNLELSDGRELFRRLVRTADVVVESFPPGYLDGLGLGYQGLCQIRPDIILTSITGFGQWGPHARYKAPDIVGVAMSGVMWLAGYMDDPPNLPYGNQGYLSASIQAAAGTLMALYHRDLTGEGQQVDVSMQEALSIAQETAMQTWDMNQAVRLREGASRLGLIVPGIGPYQCKDGWVFCLHWHAGRRYLERTPGLDDRGGSRRRPCGGTAPLAGGEHQHALHHRPHARPGLRRQRSCRTSSTSMRCCGASSLPGTSGTSTKRARDGGCSSGSSARPRTWRRTASWPFESSSRASTTRS